MTRAYYNEHDPKAAAWLRELIAADLIAPGDVDERSITDISPHELTGYTQQHFFAGIGGWSYALRLAGWPDSKLVRTGSCPCQPFSAAGKGLGTADERHLWPVFRDLITFGEATITFGEQVASAAGRDWLSGVRADLEGLGYAVGAADLCAAGVGAPHIRQRLFWMAYAQRWTAKRQRFNLAGTTSSNQTGGEKRERIRDDVRHGGNARGLGNADSAGPFTGRQTAEANGHGRSTVADGDPCGMGDTNQPGSQGRDERGNGTDQRSPWASSVVLPCTDGKARRIEPGSFPLAHGVSGRVGLLRGYGNAIVPQVAAEFIQACHEVI